MMRWCAICQTQPKIFDLTVNCVFIPSMRQEAEESSSHSAFNLRLGSNRPLNLSSEESCPPLNCYQSSDTLAGSYNGTPLLHMQAAVLAQSLFVSFTLTLQLCLISAVSSQFAQMCQWRTLSFRLVGVCWRSHPPILSTNISLEFSISQHHSQQTKLY